MLSVWIKHYILSVLLYTLYYSRHLPNKTVYKIQTSFNIETLSTYTDVAKQAVHPRGCLAEFVAKKTRQQNKSYSVAPLLCWETVHVASCNSVHDQTLWVQTRTWKDDSIHHQNLNVQRSLKNCFKLDYSETLDFLRDCWHPLADTSGKQVNHCKT